MLETMKKTSYPLTGIEKLDKMLEIDPDIRSWGHGILIDGPSNTGKTALALKILYQKLAKTNFCKPLYFDLHNGLDGSRPLPSDVRVVTSTSLKDIALNVRIGWYDHGLVIFDGVDLLSGKDQETLVCKVVGELVHKPDCPLFVYVLSHKEGEEGTDGGDDDSVWNHNSSAFKFYNNLRLMTGPDGLITVGKSALSHALGRSMVLDAPAKGKNFSTNNASGKRRKADLYETPYCLTRLLLDVVTLQGTVLEPACGNGAIVRILKTFGYQVEAYDLSQGTDFLNETKTYGTIITNPPFSLSDEFIAKAKEVADEFYFLLPLSYLHGKARYDTVYRDPHYPLRAVYIFTRYPMLGDELRPDGKHRTGMMVYAWFHFQRRPLGESFGPPTIHWLDNHQFVLGARLKKET